MANQWKDNLKYQKLDETPVIITNPPTKSNYATGTASTAAKKIITEKVLI